MATIVYDGIGDGGNLFEGAKFFIQQRVPMRQQLIAWVKENGGEVVPLEKQADIRIADHARKDCPVGSTSWTFIEKSVKNGRLEDIEDHRAGPVTQSTRPVGSKQPTKSTRTPFTSEDDRILMNWVVKAECDGLAIRGNEIYEQLAGKNNRHTSQSWRDRWIKHVSLRPRPIIDNDASPGPDGPSPAKKGPSPAKKAVRAPRGSESVSRIAFSPSSRTQDRRSSQVKKEPSRGKASTRANSPESPPDPWVAKSKGGRLFLPAEIKLLLDNYDEIINVDEDEEINAWAAWSIEYPNHTPQEWRNYFNNELTARVKELKNRESRPINRTSGSRQDSGASFSPPNIKSSISSKLLPIKTIEITPERPSITNKSIESSPASTQAPQSKISNRVADPLLTNEKQFETYVKYLAEELEIEIEIDFNPVICGKKISLFRLWQVVRADCGGIDEVEGRNLWPKVARSLNIKDSRSLEQLRSCYNIILPDVEATREEFWELTDSQEQAMIESQLQKTIEHQTENRGKEGNDQRIAIDEDEEDVDLPLPSHTQLASISLSYKRKSPEDRDGSVDNPSQSKRQWLDKGKEIEIPSTPEYIVNRQPEEHLPKSSPPRATIASPILGNNTDDQCLKISSRNSPVKLRELAGQRRIYAMEPETQDFHFPAANDGVERLEPVSTKQPQQDLEHDSLTQSETELEIATKWSEFIERCRIKGHSDENIKKSMFATMWDTAMAEEIMEALKQGIGIPGDVPGVWTSSDDDNLFPQFGPSFRAVKKKHGKERVKARTKYLKNNHGPG